MIFLFLIILGLSQACFIYKNKTHFLNNQVPIEKKLPYIVFFFFNTLPLYSFIPGSSYILTFFNIGCCLYLFGYKKCNIHINLRLVAPILLLCISSLFLDVFRTKVLLSFFYLLNSLLLLVQFSVNTKDNYEKVLEQYVFIYFATFIFSIIEIISGSHLQNSGIYYYGWNLHMATGYFFNINDLASYILFSFPFIYIYFYINREKGLFLPLVFSIVNIIFMCVLQTTIGLLAALCYFAFIIAIKTNFFSIINKMYKSEILQVLIKIILFLLLFISIKILFIIIFETTLIERFVLIFKGFDIFSNNLLGIGYTNDLLHLSFTSEILQSAFINVDRLQLILTQPMHNLFIEFLVYYGVFGFYFVFEYFSNLVRIKSIEVTSVKVALVMSICIPTIVIFLPNMIVNPIFYSYYIVLMLYIYNCSKF